MPGRPKATAAKLTKIEDLAADLWMMALDFAPADVRDTFLKNRNPMGIPIPPGASTAARGWFLLLEAVGDTALVVEIAADVARARAGITEPGPMAVLFDDASEGGTLAEAATPPASVDPGPTEQALI